MYDVAHTPTVVSITKRYQWYSLVELYSVLRKPLACVASVSQGPAGRIVMLRIGPVSNFILKSLASFSRRKPMYAAAVRAMLRDAPRRPPSRL